MKKIIIILFISFSSTLIFGQQLPYYSLYTLNEVIINPAALSKEKSNKLILMLRDQWASFEGAPTTQSISYTNLNHHKYKKGVSIMSDITGPISILNATISGAYSISLQQDHRLSLGASATFIQYKIDNSQITLENDGVFDPTLFGGIEKATSNSIALGAYYLTPNYFLGLSMPNIVGGSLNIGNNINGNKLENHYYLNGGININLKDDNKIIPSCMIKKVGALPVQLDLNLKVVYNNFLWSGVSYRMQDAVVVLIGIDYAQSSFGYSYDITTSSIRMASAGTHGLFYSYKFKTRQKEGDNDRIVDIEEGDEKILMVVENVADPDTVFITDTVFIYMPIQNNEDLKRAFKDINFAHNEHILTADDEIILDKAYAYLNNKSELRIHLQGHTDNVDSHSFNMELSKNRVKAVKKYLVDKGINKSRIKIDWKGESDPIATNDTEEGRRENRRVQLIILNNE